MPCRLAPSVLLLLLLGSWNSLPAAEHSPADLDFFEKKIRPVLVRRCYECHSAEAKKSKGGLLLDSRAGVLEGGDSGPAVVPGKAEESLLIEALRYDSVEMPPDGRLPDSVVADFVTWINRGAADPRTKDPAIRSATADSANPSAEDHWAFGPLTRPRLPKVAAGHWPTNEIDLFILHRLEQKQIVPVADADRAALLRRVYYDLIGLPPTPDEVQRFLADNSPDAYERVVDRLLASPHFGERWGRHWMDVARYADSVGGGGNLV